MTNTMLSKIYKNSWAKTAHQGQTLYEHTFQCIEAGLQLAYLVPDYSATDLDILIFGLCIHDVGKLDPTFQTMLKTRLENREYKGRLVKHEGQSLAHDHVQLVEESLSDIAKELRATLNYTLDIDRLVKNNGLEWGWATAVNHHGLFYLSYERDDDGGIRRYARRQWTNFTPREEKRLTLVDALFQFYPLGGLPIMADQIASHAFDKGYDLKELFANVNDLSDVFEKLISIAPETEASMKQDDPRDYQLRDMLLLLAGNPV